MTNPTNPTTPSKKGSNRADRLKAALKSNMARRKAQARARADGSGGIEGRGTSHKKPQGAGTTSQADDVTQAPNKAGNDPIGSSKEGR